MPEKDQGYDAVEVLAEFAALAGAYLALDSDETDLDWFTVPLEVVDAGVILCGRNGETITMNREAESILGVALDGWQKMTLAEQAKVLRMETLNGHPVSTAEAPNVGALRGEPTYHCPMVVCRGDGTRRVVTVSAVPVRGSADEVIGALTWIEDTDD